MRGARIQVSALLYLFCTGNGRGCAQLVYRETIAEALVATGISSWADTRPWFKNLWLGATCFPSGSERDALVLGARFLGIPSPSRTTAGILLYLQIFGREEHLEVFSELASSLWGSAGTPQKTNVTTTYSSFSSAWSETPGAFGHWDPGLGRPAPRGSSRPPASWGISLLERSE